MKAFRELLCHHPFWMLSLRGQFYGVITFTQNLKDPGTHWMDMGSLFWTGKWLGNSIDHTFPSSAEVKERVELYLVTPSRPSWPVLPEWTLLILYFYTLNEDLSWRTNFKYPTENWAPARNVATWLAWWTKWIFMVPLHQNLIENTRYYRMCIVFTI